MTQAGASTLNATVVGTALLASLGGFLFGFDIGYIGPIETFSGFEDSINGGEALSPATKGNIVGIFSLGAVVSSFPTITSSMNDGLGRRFTVMIGTVFFCIGAAIQAEAQSVNEMYIGRFVAGLSVGVFSSTVPMYQSEVAPKEWRGLLGATYQWAITWGILCAFMLGDSVNSKDDWGWRSVIWFQIFPGMALFFGMIVAPQSPRWLVMKGRSEKALAELIRIRGCGDVAAQELREIEQEHKESCGGDSSVLGALKSPYVRQLTFVGMAIMMLQQLCGINAFMYYGVHIFTALGQPATVFNCGIGLVNVMSTLPGMYAVDVAGRTRLLLWSALSMFLACVACGFFGHQAVASAGDAKSSIASQDAVICVVSAVVFFVFSFAYGWGPVAWVYTAEMFPLQYRSTCVALCTCVSWIGNYIIAFVTPVLMDKIQFNTFYVFAVFCVLAVLLALWLPETQGVTLEDMPELFGPKLGCSYREAGGFIKMED